MAKNSLATTLQPANALEALGDDLRPLYDTLVTQIEGLRAHSATGILLRHQVGQYLNEQLSSKDVEGDALGLLSQALIPVGGAEVSRNMLLEYMRLARVFPNREKLERLLSRRTRDGRQLTYSNLIALAGVTSGEERQKLLTAAFKEDLSFQELRSRLQKASGKGQGRKPKIPKTASAALMQLSNYRTQLSNRVPGWNQAIWERLEQAAPKVLQDEGLIAQLQKAAEDLAAIRKLAREQQEHITELLARARRVASQKPVKGDGGEVAMRRKKKKRPVVETTEEPEVSEPAESAEQAEKPAKPELTREERLARRKKIKAAKLRKERQLQTA